MHKLVSHHPRNVALQTALPILRTLVGLGILIPIHRSSEQLCALAVIVGLALTRMFLEPKEYDRTASAVLGFAIPTGAWIGPHFLLVCGVWFFVLRPVRPVSADSGSSDGSIVWLAPFLAYVLGIVLGDIVQLIVAPLAKIPSPLTGMYIDSLSRLIDAVRSFLEVHTIGFNLFIRVLLFLWWLSFFSSEHACRSKFARGLVWGTMLSALYVIAQWGGILPFSLANQTPLWSVLNRPSGLMTDPNALGVTLGLFLWVVYLAPSCMGRLYPLGGLGLITVLIAGIISGSRTFLLISFMLAVVTAWRHGRRWNILAFVCVLVVSIILTSILDVSSNWVEYIIGQQSIPTGIRRGVAALSLLRIEDTFMSRSIFLRLAEEIGRGHWAFGVGPGRFIDYVPLIGAKFDFIRGWRDNSNNFYLGILVELGVVGFVAFLLALLGRIPRVSIPRSNSLGFLVMLGIIGCTGPHADFTEVLILLALMLSMTTQPRKQFQRCYVLASLLLLALGVTSRMYQERGVYPWTNSEEGATRWLSHHAIIEAECQEGGMQRRQASIYFQPRYIPQREPLRVAFAPLGGSVQEVLLRTADATDVTVGCDKDIDRVLVRVTTTPAWSPYRAWPRLSVDRRILGVEQIYRTAKAPE